MKSVTKALCGSALAITTLAVGCRCAADVQAVAIASPPSATVPVSLTGGYPGASYAQEIYADVSDTGRFVVFQSRARNVLPGIVLSSPAENVYLFDRLTSQTTLVSHGAGSNEFGNSSSFGARISGDGSTVYFRSAATNLGGPALSGPGVYLFDRPSGSVLFIGESASHVSDESESLSEDGSWAAILGPDGLRLYGKASSSLQTVPLPPGCLVNPNFSHLLSADGRLLAFSIGCVDRPGAAAVFDRDSGLTTEIKEKGEAVGVSRNGRFVLVRGDGPGGGSELFRYDWTTGDLALASMAPDTSSSSSYRGRISDDGNIVVYSRSGSLDLCQFRLFAHDFATGSVRRLGDPGGGDCILSRHMTLSGDGRTVAYLSATERDIVVVDRVSETWRIVTTTGFPGVRPSAF